MNTEQFVDKYKDLFFVNSDDELEFNCISTRLICEECIFYNSFGDYCTLGGLEVVYDLNIRQYLRNNYPEELV